MTFLSAWRLVLLLAPIALLAAYVLVQRRRHTQVVRFTSVDAARLRGAQALRLAAPRARRRRAAVARRAHHRVRAAGDGAPDAAGPATILLALDTSASMAATDVAPNRLEAAEEQARTFVQGPARRRPGRPRHVRHVGPARSSRRPTTTPRCSTRWPRSQVGSRHRHGRRHPHLARRRRGRAARATRASRAQSAIVLMSDGTPTVAPDGQDPVQAANDAAAEAKAGRRADRHDRVRHRRRHRQRAGPGRAGAHRRRRDGHDRPG